MRATSQIDRQLGAVLLACALPFLAASQEVVTNPELAITSISLQGTNLVFSAAIPAELEQVALEMRPNLNAPWQQVASAQPTSGEGVFSIPKPEDRMEFFRLKGIAHSSSVQASAELQCVTIQSLATSPTEAVFHFKGLVDGSDRIRITHEGALWEHVHWGWPNGAVAVNAQKWNPGEKNYLTSESASKFLPERFSLDSADFHVIAGRDVVSLERAEDALVVHLDDTPAGAGEYEFEIRFHPAQSKVARSETSTAARLKITAQIDGSDLVKITPREATWLHKTYGLPSDVTMNGVVWPLAQTAVLKNEGTNAFLPDGVDLSSARIVSRKGRDLATMWAEANALWVTFADNPNGSDYYELEIAFGQ